MRKTESYTQVSSPRAKKKRKENTRTKKKKKKLFRIQLSTYPSVSRTKCNFSLNQKLYLSRVWFGFLGIEGGKTQSLREGLIYTQQVIILIIRQSNKEQLIQEKTLSD